MKESVVWMAKFQIWLRRWPLDMVLIILIFTVQAGDPMMVIAVNY